MRRHQFPDYFGSRRSIEPVYGHAQDDYQPRGQAFGAGAGSNVDRDNSFTEYQDQNQSHNHDSDNLYPYSVQPVSRPTPVAETPRASFSRNSAFRPNQWAQSGTLSAPKPTSAATPAPATTRQNFLRSFAYNEPASNLGRATPQPPRVQPSTYVAQTPRHQTLRPHNSTDQPLPRTPWSNRATARPNWLRQPRPDSLEAYRTPMYGNGGYGAQQQQEEYEQEPEPEPEPEPYIPPPYNSYSRSNNSSHGSRRTPAPPTASRARSRQSNMMAPPTPRYSSPSPLGPARAPIQARHNPAPQVNGIKLVSPQAVDKRFQGIFPYEHFNDMQSSCFSCVYGSSYNVVVAAPTGSGKTVVFELAICKLLASRDKKDFKIVYQAPTKALCSERARDWQNKFKPLGLQVAEFTGDTSAAEVRRARTASVIITTPEKWDSITRKWSDHGALLKTIKLVLIDEVHILKDTRGATLETVVSRMKALGNEVRFVALSATIPNSTDIAQWLGLTHTSPQVPAKTFVCGEEFRPVRLEKIVIGFNLGGGNEHSLDSMLDDQLPDLIVKHAQGKPVLIFCFTRKSTESAAQALAEYWGMCSASQKPWPGPSVGIRSSARLQNLVTAGVAFHHGGLERQDRASIEEAFLRGHLSIVCCTSTLAVGVNLPCHTVILKGTTGYQNGKFSEYDEFEVMQMIGRAGRPQFDTSATAIILTRAENKGKYENIESGCQTVESTLHLNLIEHLNSEIVLGTITSLQKAVQWLRRTFLAVRLRQNPDHYKLTDETTLARTTDEQLEEICKAGIERLAEVGLIKYHEGSETDFRGTPYGSAMSTYMVRFDTMVMLLKLENTLTMEELVNALCHASEFDELRMKTTERQGIRDLNKEQDIPFKFKDTIMETWQKISVLIQVELARGSLPYQQRMAMEARQAIERMQRLLESYIFCMIADNSGHATKTALDFSRSLMAKAWEGHHAQLCQVPDIGPANMKKLVDKNVSTVLDLADLGPVGIERLLNKNPPAAMKIADTLRTFPRLILDGHVAKAQTGPGTGTGVKAVASVKLGYMNESLPRWRNRIPSVTFLATTEEGTLLHIWRGKLPEQEHEISFTVSAEDVDLVHCHYTCDDIVGTMQSLKLPCVEVPREELARYPTGASTQTSSTPKTTVSVLREAQPARRQNQINYTTHPVTVGDTVVDCIDLSSLDETNTYGGPVRPPRNGPSQAPASTASFQDSGDSFAFQTVPARQPRHCSGGGTQQDPLTLDDSGSDDYDETFDTSIFDDIEMPTIKESPERRPSSPKRQPSIPKRKASATKRKASDARPVEEIPPKRKPSKAEAAPAPPVFNRHHLDSFSDDDDVVPETRDSSPQPVAAPTSVDVPTTIAVVESEGENTQNAKKTNTVEEIRPDVEEPAFQEDPIPPERTEEEEESMIEPLDKETEKPEEPEKETPKETPKEPAEPSWVSMSSSSIVDFLRGHVKFI